MMALRSLPKARDFRRVYAEGVRARRDDVTVYTVRRPGDGGMVRLGLAVPGRGAGAVVRNRVRRRLRAAFEVAAGESAEALDVVVRGAPSLATKNYQQLVKDVGGALRATGMLR